MDENDKGYTENGLYYKGVHASDLWPVSDLMGGATRRQIKAIIDNPAPRDARGATMVADYQARVAKSDQAWAERGVDETESGRSV